MMPMIQLIRKTQMAETSNHGLSAGLVELQGLALVGAAECENVCVCM